MLNELVFIKRSIFEFFNNGRVVLTVYYLVHIYIFELEKALHTLFRRREKAGGFGTGEKKLSNFIRRHCESIPLDRLHEGSRSEKILSFHFGEE